MNSLDEIIRQAIADSIKAESSNGPTYLFICINQTQIIDLYDKIVSKIRSLPDWINVDLRGNSNRITINNSVKLMLVKDSSNIIGLSVDHVINVMPPNITSLTITGKIHNIYV